MDHNPERQFAPTGRLPAIAYSPNYKWYVVGMLWFTGFFNYADRQVIFSLFPLLQKEMSLTPIELGMLGSAFALVYGLCAPFAGNIVDRVRRKSAVLWSLFAWSMACMATGLARGLSHLVFFRAVLGLSETSYFPAAMSMISDYHGQKTRSRAMGSHQTSVYLGTIAGGFLGGMIGQYYGWRWGFAIFGLLGILLGFGLIKLLVEPRRGYTDLEELGVEEVTAKKTISIAKFLKVIWGTPTLMLLMGAFMLDNFVGMVLLSWMPMFLYEKFSLIISLTVWGLFKGMYDANIFAAALDVVRPEARGTTVGFMNTIGWLVGAGTAPIFIGYVAQHSSLSFAISIAALALVIASGLLLTAIIFTVRKDVDRLHNTLKAEIK